MLGDITGVKGVGAYEKLILASIIAGVNPVFSGDTGVAKTQLCDAIGKLLVRGLEIRKDIKMDAASIHAVNSAPENMAGMDIPHVESQEMRLFKSHKNVLNAFTIFMDEITRIGDNPINQSKLLSAIAEGEIDGQTLSYYLIMAACNLNRNEDDDSFQVEKLDKAFAHRFACIIEVPSLHEQSSDDREEILKASLEGNHFDPFSLTKKDYDNGMFKNKKRLFTPKDKDAEVFFDFIAKKRKEFLEHKEYFIDQLAKYTSVVIKEAAGAYEIDTYQGRWGRNIQSMVLAYYILSKSEKVKDKNGLRAFSLQDAAKEVIYPCISIKRLYDPENSPKNDTVMKLHKHAEMHLKQEDNLMKKIMNEKDVIIRVAIALKADKGELEASDFSRLISDVLESTDYNEREKSFFAYLVTVSNTKLRIHQQVTGILTRKQNELLVDDYITKGTKVAQDAISAESKIVQLAVKKECLSLDEPSDQQILDLVSVCSDEFEQIYSKGFKKLVNKKKV